MRAPPRGEGYAPCVRNAMARLVILGSRGAIWAAELFGHEKVADFHSKLMCGRPFGGEPSERNTLPSIIEPRDDAVRSYRWELSWQSVGVDVSI